MRVCAYVHERNGRRTSEVRAPTSIEMVNTARAHESTYALTRAHTHTQHIHARARSLTLTHSLSYSRSLTHARALSLHSPPPPTPSSLPLSLSLNHSHTHPLSTPLSFSQSSARPSHILHAIFPYKHTLDHPTCSVTLRAQSKAKATSALRACLDPFQEVVCLLYPRLNFDVRALGSSFPTFPHSPPLPAPALSLYLARSTTDLFHRCLHYLRVRLRVAFVSAFLPRSNVSDVCFPT